MSRTALVAIGGNSLIRAGEKGTIVEQLANTRRTAGAIVGLIQDGFSLVITHGNGPQVGAALLRSERASDQVYGQSLDVCDATTQGEIGYLLQQSLCNALQTAGLLVQVATVLSQVVVSADDPAMRHPTKPIGPFYSRGRRRRGPASAGGVVPPPALRWSSPEPSRSSRPVVRTCSVGVLVVAAGAASVVRRRGLRCRAVIDGPRLGPARRRLGVALRHLHRHRPVTSTTSSRPAGGALTTPSWRRTAQALPPEHGPQRSSRPALPGGGGQESVNLVRAPRGGVRGRSEAPVVP
jgi:hypothetical protein